jgi:hypothetical protein
MAHRIVLPPEIIDLFVSLDHLMLRDVRSASLVSRAWREPAQRAVFSHLKFNSDSCDPETPSLTARNEIDVTRLRFFASRPDLAGLVRSVKYVFCTWNNTYMNTDCTLPIFPILVDMFPYVTTFVLFLRDPVYRKVLPIVLSGWPHLETLKLMLPLSIPYGVDHSLLLPTASEEMSPADPARGPTRLHTLEVRLAYELPQVLNPLEHLHNTPTRHSLERAYLVFLLNIKNGVDVDSEYARPFARLIRVTNAFVNLRELDLVLMYRLSRWFSNSGGPKGTSLFLSSPTGNFLSSLPPPSSSLHPSITLHQHNF